MEKAIFIWVKCVRVCYHVRTHNQNNGKKNTLNSPDWIDGSIANTKPLLNLKRLGTKGKAHFEFITKITSPLIWFEGGFIPDVVSNFLWRLLTLKRTHIAFDVITIDSLSSLSIPPIRACVNVVCWRPVSDVISISYLTFHLLEKSCSAQAYNVSQLFQQSAWPYHHQL